MSRPRCGGVNVVGYLEAELGVGEAARQLIGALESQGVPVARIGRWLEDTRNDHPFAHQPAPTQGPFGVNLLCENAAFTPEAVAELGRPFFEGRYTVGLWFWEVTSFPEEWDRSFGFVDEVWVASEHVASAIRSRSPVPVTRISLPVEPETPEPLGRAELGLPSGFCFLLVFDYNSVLERKNPLGLVEAFERAFGSADGVALVLKAINGDRHPEARDRVRAAAAAHPCVHLVEDFLPARRKNALIASCDCYVSLHRSEGFGLTLAEAMYFERPVIATAYSGNLEFMTPENSYPVGCDLRRIGSGSEPYPAEGEWADPDLSEAAALMRRVVEHRDEAAERGWRAGEDIRRTHSRQAAARAMRERLGAIDAFASRGGWVPRRLRRL